MHLLQNNKCATAKDCPIIWGKRMTGKLQFSWVTYQTSAGSPQDKERYLKFRSFLTASPERQDD
jgi:hypothetical protein